MTTVIAFVICAALFVCAIVLLKYMFVKAVNNEKFIAGRIALGACLAACFSVIGIVPML